MRKKHQISCFGHLNGKPSRICDRKETQKRPTLTGGGLWCILPHQYMSQRETQGGCDRDHAQAWATAWVQRARVQEGKGHSGHIDPHQASPAVPELILDSHLKVPDRRPRATLTTNLSADGLKRAWTRWTRNALNVRCTFPTCLDVLHVCSFGYVFGIKNMFA